MDAVDVGMFVELHFWNADWADNLACEKRSRSTTSDVVYDLMVHHGARKQESLIAWKVNAQYLFSSAFS